MKATILALALALAALAIAPAAGASDARLWRAQDAAKRLQAKNPQFVPGARTNIQFVMTCVGIRPRALAGGYEVWRNFRCGVRYTLGASAKQLYGAVFVRPHTATTFCWSAVSLEVLAKNPGC